MNKARMAVEAKVAVVVCDAGFKAPNKCNIVCEGCFQLVSVRPGGAEV